MEKKADCPCKSTHCQRRGNCTACQAYHRENGGATTCQRQAAKPPEK